MDAFEPFDLSTLTLPAGTSAGETAADSPSLPINFEEDPDSSTYTGFCVVA
ncbi:hypothetical protein BT96DRAFT_922168 [Gymnopus androsaceus JB14]|uniref:Pheromone n=1 Tax=Gymnopus androsaceus JB14 TaxID=1447944 RepID=A0A6A4HF36_9AGAR|nr:hypothetical protein BT96DRAFT_922168 [Gymnopus androsaceus JB14]